jgi:hypothetical protein
LNVTLTILSYALSMIMVKIPVKFHPHTSHVLLLRRLLHRLQETIAILTLALAIIPLKLEQLTMNMTWILLLPFFLGVSYLLHGK